MAQSVQLESKLLFSGDRRARSFGGRGREIENAY